MCFSGNVFLRKLCFSGNCVSPEIVFLRKLCFSGFHLFSPRFLYTWLVSWHGEVVDDGFEWVVGMERGKEVGEEGDVRMSYLHTVVYTYSS